MNRKEIKGIKELIPTILEGIEYIKSNPIEKVMPLLDNVVDALQYLINITEEKDLSFFVQGFNKVNYEKNNMDLLNSLEKKLLEILDRLNKIKKEVVFLPYNATMWDSFESIWMAAKDDERCNCHVIPIPYYTKNADSSLSDLIYDGDKFPEYVPITHYRDYNIYEKNPDVIYFHNPYDNYNRVTTVHPDYYSVNLKNHTDMLVYVPYFVVNSKLKEEYCILPGIKNADYVIVQSEKVAEEYKKYYLYQDRNKFLPLGSPKIDKAILMSKTNNIDSDTPDEWKKKIQGKKVVLYNTHLYSIMNEGEKLIKKIEYIFSVFEKQKDAILIWRPHPLSKKTANTFNPKIINNLIELEKKARSCEYCIFDDTANLHRSIAISDAYFGDRSSLVELFRTLKKPVMIQDIDIQREKKWEEINKISFEDAYIDGEKIWFSASNLNGLFCIDKKSGETEFKGVFPGENIDGVRLFSKVAYADKKLYFIPFYASCIMEYEIDSEKFIRIEIEENIGPGKFLSYSIYGDYIYFIPRAFGSVLRYNFKKKNLEVMYEWDLKIRESEPKEDVLFAGVVQKDGKLYCPMYHRNIMFKFDLISENAEYFELGEEKDMFMSIQYDGEMFWLIPKNRDRIVYWDEDKNEINYIGDYPKDFKFLNERGPFLKSFLKDEMLWILPCFSDSILIINTKSKKMKAIKFQEGNLDSEIKKEMFWEFGGIADYGEDVIIFPINRDSALIVDKKGEIKEILKTDLPQNYTREDLIISPKKNDFGDYVENNLFGFLQYIQKINNENIRNIDEKEEFETSGKKISDFFLK